MLLFLCLLAKFSCFLVSPVFWLVPVFGLDYILSQVVSHSAVSCFFSGIISAVLPCAFFVRFRHLVYEFQFEVFSDLPHGFELFSPISLFLILFWVFFPTFVWPHFFFPVLAWLCLCLMIFRLLKKISLAFRSIWLEIMGSVFYFSLASWLIHLHITSLLLFAETIVEICCMIHEKEIISMAPFIPFHYPTSNPLKKCCISAFSFFFSLSTVSWTFSSWIVVLANESMQQKHHPNWPAWRHCFSLIFSRPCSLEKCLRRHVLLGVGFQWMLWKQFIQLIDKGRPRLYSMPEAWHRSEARFWLREPWRPCFLKNVSEYMLAKGSFVHFWQIHSCLFLTASQPRCLAFKSDFKHSAKIALVFYWEATNKS